MKLKQAPIYQISHLFSYQLHIDKDIPIKEREILIIFVFLYLIFKSGETDQKTMITFIYFFSIYYFLQQKWIKSALFVGLTFYIHIGMALWWFLPSVFALAIVFFAHKKISKLKILFIYIFVTTALSFPILYFYVLELNNQNLITSDFFTRHIYGTGNSILYYFTTQKGWANFDYHLIEFWCHYIYTYYLWYVSIYNYLFYIHLYKT